MTYSIIKSKYRKDYIFLKFINFHLLITLITINCEINIFPDHHSEYDPNFNRSQVKGITNESFYYDLGYFTNLTEKYRSPKYGLNFRPVLCEKMPECEDEPIYNNNDTESFFGPQKGIKNIESTLEMNNKFEETKLFRNTIKGYNFTCPSPIRAFHRKDFEINITIPMIAESDMEISINLVSENGEVNNTIGTFVLQANKVEKATLLIFPQKDNGENATMNFKYTRDGTPIEGVDPLFIVGDPDLSIQFISQTKGNLILSNYRVTITDLTTITGTPFNFSMIRSKNGILSNCTKDSDCFIGFMCSHFNCTPCHSTCTECYQDDLNAAGTNYCKECNVMSTTSKPHDGYCDIGYVDLTLFKDFEVKVKPDGQDFDDRETLGFWLFLTDTELSRKRDPKEREEFGLLPEPEPKDILHHVVLKNRFVITIIQRIRKFSVYCHVHENIFSRNTSDHLYFHDPNNMEDIGKNNKKVYRYFTPHEYYYLNFSVPSENQRKVMVGNEEDQDNEFDKTIDGHWVHVSCAESFDHGLYYLKTVINGKTESKEDHLYHEPFLRTFEDGELKNVDVMNDKYFKSIIYEDNNLYLQFLNFNYSMSKIYMRHLTLFKEYIPIKMQYMYFDYSGVTNFYELLYYIPFTQLIYGNKYKIKGYSYEYQEEDIILELNSTDSRFIIGDVSPPLNFIHLNFPSMNYKYTEIDLVPTEIKALSKTDDMKYVYDDNSPMSCELYLNTETNECNRNCVDYRKLPFQGVNDKSGYCEYTCTDSMTCLKDQPTGKELDYDGGFCTDLSEAYNLFFRCEDDQIDYYLQYSGFYNSAKMEKRIEKMQSYLIDFWYYDDYLLKELKEKFFGEPSEKMHYVLHTNVIDLYFLINETNLQYLKDNINKKKQRKVGYQYYNHTIYYSVKDSRNSPLIFRHQEWNRITIYSRFNRTVEKYQISVCLNYYYTDLRGDETGKCSGLEELYPSIGTLENIIFCDKVCQDWQDNIIHWATGYYKNFRIWDGNAVSLHILAQYDTFYPDYVYRVSALKYSFPMTNKYISNNQVFDPKNKESFSISSGKYKFKKYNFSSKFDVIAVQKLYGKGYLMNYRDIYIQGTEVSKIVNCEEGCERCWCTWRYQDRCYKCSTGYYITQEYHCYKIGSHYFKSPNLLNRDLDATVSKITLIENKEAVTVTFWFKTFGFSGDDHITMFTIGEHLSVVFSSTDTDPVRPYGLSIVNDERLIANVFEFRNMIGDWLFFSLAYHREMSDFGTNYFPTMMKFELALRSYEVNITNVKPDMSLDSFSIKKDYWGLLTDLKFYHNYIISSYGYEMQLHEEIDTTPFYIPEPVASFFMRAGTNKACFQTSYLTGANINDFECVPDESPSHNYACIDCCVPDLSESDDVINLNKVCFNECYKVGNTSNSCTCIAKNSNSQLILRNTDKNACVSMDYINFANCEDILIENVQTAKLTKRYTMQFWMYAYNYINGRFGGVEFYWDGHNKIVVEKGSQTNGNNKYEFHCIPYLNEDGSVPRKLTKIIEINKWNYLSCAVDFVEINYYINVNTYYHELELERANLIQTSPTNLLLTQTKTTLSIKDTTKFRDWGLLFFEHIRLWNWCYFNAEFLSRLNLRKKSKFPYLLEQWEPWHPLKWETDKYFENFIVYELTKNNKFEVRFSQKYGMNVLDDYFYNHIKNCSEDGEYYDVAQEKCLQFIDASKLNDFYFKKLPIAYSGSYSMSIWIFFEDATVISQGVHINWSKHLQITIIKNDRLEAYCFPQGYYSDTVSNDNIQNKFSSALNAAEVYLVDEQTSESAVWINVICAMSHYNRRYYVNGMDEKTLSIKTLNNEILYKESNGETINSFYPMRYYFSEAYTDHDLNSTLGITNIKSTKRIYFRAITLFRDYIPYWYNKYLRNMNLVNLENGRMPSVLFFCNFVEVNITTRVLRYRYQYRNIIGNTNYKFFSKTITLSLHSDYNNPSTTFELSANFRFMPLCEFATKVKMKYDPNRNYCVFIADCDLTDLNAYYCMEERTPICCLPNYYITSDSSGQIYCRGGCEIDEIRNPGTNATQGICNSQCHEGTKQCPGSSSAHLKDYPTNFKCEDNTYRIGFHCVNKQYNLQSALFFSKCYNSPNFSVKIDSESQYLFRTGYFLEFWIKLDKMLNECQDGFKTNIKEYYFRSVPHSIYMNTSTNIFYYQFKETKLINEISGLNEYEWNKFYIRTKIDERQIDLFLNFEIANPKFTFNEDNGLSQTEDLQLNKISFCSRYYNDNKNYCNNPEINWGSAYYKNIRVWDERTTTIRMVQDFNNELFSEFPNSLILYYPLTVQYMDLNIITEIIYGIDNFIISHPATDEFRSTDKDIFYNYEINHDWGEVNPGYFISALGQTEEDNGIVTPTACNPACKRCFSATATNCYECNEGYVLNGMECIRINGYFLKIPARTLNTIIPFKIEKDNTKVKDLSAWTFCIYMKFEGILAGGSSEAIIIQFKSDIYIAYDVETTDLIFIVQSKEAFRDTNFKQYFGTWIPICVADYVSGKVLNEIYPNMLTINVNKIDIPFNDDFSIPNEGVKIDQISLHYQVIAFFADFRIYDRFIQGNFGTIISSTEASNHLFIYYSLEGNNACIQGDYLTTTQIIEVDCVPDYNIYVDSSRKCVDKTYFFDVQYDSENIPCSSCDETCVTLCFQSNNQQCTCDMADGLFWLRKHKTTHQTYCEYLPFIDFSAINDVTILVPSSGTYESTLEVWFFAYSYNLNTFNFKQISIIWNLHNKIVVYVKNNELFAKCYGLWDEERESYYTENIEQKIYEYKWNLLRCGSEFISNYTSDPDDPLNKPKYFFNGKEEKLVIQEYPEDRIGKVTQLKIINVENSYDSYGFVFLRELKLWQQYNKKFIDTSYIDLQSYGLYNKELRKTSGIFPGLIGYFKNDFKITDYEAELNSPHRYTIFNLLGGEANVEVHLVNKWTVTRRTNFIGYNIVDPTNKGNYKDLTLCEEGEVYSESSDTCSKPITTHCEYPGDIGDKCITCPEETIYINIVDGSCTNTCPALYYPRDDINECRECHFTCYTCTGPFYNNCTSCTGNYSLVSDLHICTKYCEKYGLTMSPDDHNMCIPFDADAELVNYHENIPIDKETFEELEAAVTFYTSINYRTKWEFDPNATREINNLTNMTFPFDTPFNGDIYNLLTSIDNTFFVLAKKYVVNLIIISNNINFPEYSINITVPFVLTINSYPFNGKFVIAPKIGLYNTTTFLIKCKNYDDDTTKNLLYIFYAKEKGTTTTTILRGWSSEDETTSNFTVEYYALPSSSITITCVIRDNYGATTVATQDIVIANSPNNGIYDLKKALLLYDLPTMRTDLICYHRSQYLMSLGIDNYKVLQPNLFQTKYEPSLDSSMMTKTDPACTLDYCNNNGYCDLMDEFINCHCDTGFIGRNCHVDKNGYETLESYYNDLFNKLIGDLKENITYFEFKTFHNLYFGACQFFQDKNFFSLNLDTFLALAMNQYRDSILNNTAEYFDLLDYYYSYEMMLMEQERGKIKYLTGLKVRNISLGEESMEGYKESFEYIQEELIKLMKYIANEYIPTKNSFFYESKNFYIALSPIERGFDEIEFFKKRKEKYKTQVEFMNCVNYIEVERLKNANYYLYLFYIEYYYFPYAYNNTLLKNNTGPLIELRLMDTRTGKFLSISGCEDIYSIKYTIPYSGYYYLDDFNLQKEMYDPNVYKGPDDDIFADPIYIMPNGNVTDSTIEERIKLYNRIYNITPKYFDELLNDFNDTGLTYLNFTNDTNFIIFSSTHLTKLAAFFVPNNATFHTNGRFFYLLRPKIFFFFPNYLQSVGGFLFLILLVLYLTFLSIFTIYDKEFSDQVALIEYIKEEVVDLFLHYHKEEDKNKNNYIPNKLRNRYDHREFKNNRDYGPAGYTEGITSNQTLENYQIFGKNKKNKITNLNYNKDILDELSLDEDDDIYNNKEKPVKKNFFSGDVKFKRKTAEEELKRKKNSSFLRNRKDNGQDNTNRQSKYHHNYLPEEFENEEESNKEQIQSFADIKLSFCEFLTLNIKCRSILINSFCIVSVFNPRWKKLSLLMTEICVIIIFVSIFLTSDENAIHSSLGKMLVYSIYSMVATDCTIYLIAFFYKFPNKGQRRLFVLVKTGGQLIMIKEWEKIDRKLKKLAIIGMIICVLIWLFSFYASFGFTIVWKYQNFGFFECFGLCLIFNFVICEFLIELLIAILFTQRKHNFFLRAIAEGLNKLRNYRCLSP